MVLFLVDESLSPQLATKLKNLDYNSKSIRDVGLRGLEDLKIVEWAIQNDAIIITGDLDFGELWYWYFKGKLGIIVLRIKSYNLEMQYRVLKYLHDNNVLKDKKIKNSLIISTATRYRIRTK